MHLLKLYLSYSSEINQIKDHKYCNNKLIIYRLIGKGHTAIKDIIKQLVIVTQFQIWIFMF